MPETPSISHAASAAMLAMTSLATRTEPNDPLLPIQGDATAWRHCPACLGALHVGLASRVYSDQIARLDEQRHLDHGAGFELGRLRGAGDRVTFEARVGLDHSQLDVDRQLDSDELALVRQ